MQKLNSTFLVAGARVFATVAAPVARTVRAAMAMGVEFPLRQVALQRNSFDPRRMISGAMQVSSGVAEVAKLQFKEGCAYLRP